MAQAKKMDESAFAKIIKEFNAFGELIRSKQEAKQAVMDEFDSESKRFFLGKISEKTLESSVRKTNKEIQKLDDEIRSAIQTANDLANQAKRFASKQAPRRFTATLSGVIRPGQKKKKKSNKKKSPAKRKRKSSSKKKSAPKKSTRKAPAKRKKTSRKKR